MRDWIELVKEFFFDLGTWGKIFFILVCITLLCWAISIISFVIVSILTLQIVPLLAIAFFIFTLIAGSKALTEDL